MRVRLRSALTVVQNRTECLTDRAGLSVHTPTLQHLPHTTMLDHYVFAGLAVIFAAMAVTAYEVKRGPGGSDVG